MQSKNYKLGIVKRYDGYIGEIIPIGEVITRDMIYYFTKNDVNNNDIIEQKDLVQFNSKTEEGFPQAYYVNKVYLKKL